MGRASTGELAPLYGLLSDLARYSEVKIIASSGTRRSSSVTSSTAPPA
jgi:hypothetical protein